MSLSDVAAVILLAHQKFTEPEKAKEALKATFKKDFPYWVFSEWDVEISSLAAKQILKQYKKSAPVTIGQLIIELPAKANE